MRTELIAVYGEPGCGKTMFSLCLAHKLQQVEKGYVVYVSADTLIPQLAVLLPNIEHSEKDCLGRLLLRSNYTPQMAMSYLFDHPQNANLGIMGFAPGVTPLTYRFTQGDVRTLIDCLGKLELGGENKDYIIIDCNADPLGDPLTEYAISHADHRLRLVTADVRGLMYERSARAALRDEQYGWKDTWLVASRLLPETPMEECVGAFGKFQLVLPYSKELEFTFAGGRLPIGAQKRPGVLYEAEVSRCAEMLARAGRDL